MTGANPRLARTFAFAALAAGAVAAWLVSDYTAGVEQRAGKPVRVLVASQAIARGEMLTADALGAVVVSRNVPQRYAPADAVQSLDRLVGARAIADIAQGAYLTQALFASGAAGGAGYRLRRAERAVTIDTKVAPRGATVQPGAIVDVFASGFAGGSTTELVLQGAEVLSAAEAGSDAAGQGITLRVDSAQVPALIRGDVFARELRTIIRP